MGSVKALSVECPHCGAPNSEVRGASLDASGHRIRFRRCSTCESHFTSLEIAVPFSFSGADSLTRERHHTDTYPPRRSSDYFTVEKKSEDRWVVALHKGKPANTCRRGLHVLKGDNVYIHPNGQRICKPCRRENSKGRYRNRMEKMPPALLEEHRAQNRVYNARRSEARKEWMRRKRAAERAA